MRGRIASILSLIIVSFLWSCKPNNKTETTIAPRQAPPKLWVAPDTSTIPFTSEGKLIRYGRELIAHTAKYLGPNGNVKNMSNGMNCQNCHLAAGTKPFGNNYGSVASLYPKFRPRSGKMESVEKRVNDCLERSLNGKPLDSLSNEMQAM